MFEVDEIRYCKNCGAKKSQSFKYCLNCGSLYSKNTTPFSQPQSKQKQNDLTEEKKDEAEEIEVLNTPKKEINYCPNCGMKRILEDLYCIECGYKYKNIINGDSSSANALNSDSNNDSNILWSILYVFAIINAVLFMPVAGILAIVFFFITLADFEYIILFIPAAAYFIASIYFLKTAMKKTNN